MFPFPTFVLFVLFCFARVIYQLGYTEKGYGGHGPGYGLDRVATLTISGLLILAYSKTF